MLLLYMNTSKKYIKNMKKIFLVFILTMISIIGFGQISENIQSWTSHASYGAYTQAITAGNVTMTDCIITPGGTSSGTATTGYVQMKAATGIIALPSLSSCGTVEFRIHAGGW